MPAGRRTAGRGKCCGKPPPLPNTRCQYTAAVMTATRRPFLPARRHIAAWVALLGLVFHGLLLVVAVGSGATGIVGLGMMNQATDRIELAGTSMSEGARLNRNVVELNRSEEHTSELQSIMRNSY